MNKILKAGLYVTGGVALIAIANHYYKKSKAPIGGSASTGSSAAGMRNAAGKKGGRYVVGGYNATTNMTYIFPVGNTGGGVWVAGYVNAPQGTQFNYNP